MTCRYYRCPTRASWTARTPHGDLVDLCANHAADGVAVGRWEGIAPIEAVRLRPEGIARQGDFLEATG